jgi:predicted RNA binding protein YcfA (HicA-like mRNA interferase family)
MKRFKVREIIRVLTTNSYYVVAQKGSHRKFKHNDKSGKLTVNGKPNETLSQEILNSIFKQVGLK